MPVKLQIAVSRASPIFQERFSDAVSSKGGLVGSLILNVLVNNFSVMLGQSHRFLGIIPVLLGSKCALLKDTTRFDPSGA